MMRNGSMELSWETKCLEYDYQKRISTWLQYSDLRSEGFYLPSENEELRHDERGVAPQQQRTHPPPTTNDHNKE
jgi:hypothetical protein